MGLDNIKLKLAPSHNNAPYIALYHALSDLANGVAIVVGGLLLDRLLAASKATTEPTATVGLYAQLFLFAWIGRTLLAFLAARLIEPGARTLGEVFSRR